MSEQILTCVKFSEETKYGTYEDIIYFEPDVYAKTDPKEIEQMKQGRIDAYVFRVENPPPEPEPTKEDLEAQIAALESDLANLTATKAEVQTKLDAVIAAEPPIKIDPILVDPGIIVDDGGIKP